MAKRNLPKRLFKSQDRVSSYATGQSGTKLMKRVSRDHSDVLQNIEAVLVSRRRGDSGMDDRTASAALRACINGTEPDDERAAEVADEIRTIREFRTDVDDNIWRDALRVVDDSVHLHSSLQPGEASYLRFVANYVK